MRQLSLTCRPGSQRVNLISSGVKQDGIVVIPLAHEIVATVFGHDRSDIGFAKPIVVFLPGLSEMIIIDRKVTDQSADSFLPFPELVEARRCPLGDGGSLRKVETLLFPWR